MTGEKLVLVLHPDPGQPINGPFIAGVVERNRRLLNYKRVSSYVLWDTDFPRTASLKIKRAELAEQIRAKIERESVVPL
jgi:acyl-CoA synthetase (AMP-forming)/AMP-acid ligase II